MRKYSRMVALRRVMDKPYVILMAALNLIAIALLFILWTYASAPSAVEVLLGASLAFIAFVISLMGIFSVQRRDMRQSRLESQLRRQNDHQDRQAPNHVSEAMPVTTPHEGSGAELSNERATQRGGNEGTVDATLGGQTTSAPHKLVEPTKAVKPTTDQSATVDQLPDRQIKSPKALTASGPGQVSTVVTLDELYNNFETEPSVRNLELLLMRMWNVYGEITRPAALIHKYPDLVEKFSPRSALLALQIGDAANLLADLPKIPARSKGAIYNPVPNRVLYTVHATPIFHTNGYAIRTQGIAEGMCANGKDVRVVARPGYPWDVKVQGKPPRERYSHEQSGVEYVHLPSTGLDVVAKGAYIQNAVDELVREVLDYRAEVIQSASNSQTALIALIAARRLGIPFVYEVRGLWEITQRATSPIWGESERYQLDVELERLVASEADSVAAITRQLRDELIRRGVSGDRIAIVPNAVNTDELLPIPKDPFYEVFPGSNRSPLIGFVGSIVEYEGLGLLIEAVHRLNSDGVACNLAIVGSGANEEALKEQARQLGAEDSSVHFLGRVPHDEVRSVLASLDVVVCPRSSNAVTEMVSPLKPLEAYAAGRVVLMSDVAPQKDLSNNGEIAPLFAADNLDSLIQNLRGLLVNPEARRAYERRARMWVSDHRTWVKVGAAMLESHRYARQIYAAEISAGPAQRSMSQLRIVLASNSDDILGVSQHCETIPVSLSSDQLSGYFCEDDIDALVIDGRGETVGRKKSLISDLLGTASSRGVTTILLVDKGSVEAQRTEGIMTYADHICYVGGSKPDHDFEMYVSRGATLSSVGPAFDPRTASPLGIVFNRDAVKILEDSYPPMNCMEIARAHNLEICETHYNVKVLPERFKESRRIFQDVNSAVSDVVSSAAVIRNTEFYDRQLSLDITATGGTELFTSPETDLDEFDSWLKASIKNAGDWRESIWRNLRRVHQTSTNRQTLALMLRSAGIQFEHRVYPAYAVSLSNERKDLISELLNQTVQPDAIVVPEDFDGQASVNQLCEEKGVRLLSRIPGDVEFAGEVTDSLPATYFEDALIAFSFGDFAAVHVSRTSGHGSRIAAVGESEDRGKLALRRVTPNSGRRLTRTVNIYGFAGVEVSTEHTGTGEPALISVQEKLDATNVLVAGHDLKFVAPLIEKLRRDGVEIAEDKWCFHNSHDEQQSLSLLRQADVILCEWGMGNAVWYSQHKQADQHLIVRVHSQELRTNYLRRIDHAAVDQYIFVSEIVRSAAVAFHGVPLEKTAILPNAVDADGLNVEKLPNSEKVIGFVGSVPQTKRLDLALDVFELVHEVDSSYRLIVKGRGADEYPWMANRPAELAWYQQQYQRIDTLNMERPGVVKLEGYGSDMGTWYSKIGVALSTSDFESFHYTIADGVASGARPAILYWPGADTVYPRSWISNSIEELAESILTSEPKASDRKFIIESFSIDSIAARLKSILLGSGAPYERI